MTKIPAVIPYVAPYPALHVAGQVSPSEATSPSSSRSRTPSPVPSTAGSTSDSTTSVGGDSFVAGSAKGKAAAEAPATHTPSTEATASAPGTQEPPAAAAKSQLEQLLDGCQVAFVAAGQAVLALLQYVQQLAQSSVLGAAVKVQAGYQRAKTAVVHAAHEVKAGLRVPLVKVRDAALPRPSSEEPQNAYTAAKTWTKQHLLRSSQWLLAKLA